MGGNAVIGVGAVHISEIPPTLRSIEKSLDLAHLSLDNSVLGSVGKKEYSGDIDLVFPPLEKDEMVCFLEKLRNIYGKDNVRKSGNTINVAVEIADFDSCYNDRLPRTGKVQVDFMFADVEFTKFFNYSPGNESAYKGVHRNLAISAVASYTDRIESKELDGFGRPSTIIRWKWSPSGFFKIQRVSRLDKHGQWIKSQRDEQISEAETNPDKISQILFDPAANSDDTNSVESIIAACKKYFDSDKQARVFARIAHNLKEYNMRSSKTNLSSYGVPEDILPYMETEDLPV